MILDTDRSQRSNFTKYWGMAAIPGLLIGYGIINNDADNYVVLGVISLLIGFIGYAMTIRSAYWRRRARKGIKLDERQLLVLNKAYNYAFRGLAVFVLLMLVYIAFIAKAGDRLWVPHTSQEWRSLVLPVALILPILPTVIAEWLDPAADEED